MRKLSFLLLSYMVCSIPLGLLPSFGQPASPLLLRVHVPAAMEAAPWAVRASVDRASLARLWSSRLPSGLIAASEAIGGQERSVPAQCDLIGERVQIALLLPPQPAGERLVRVLPQAPAALPEMPRLTVTKEGEAIIVRNATYEITHDPKKNAGLPARIVFRETGKIFDTFMFNDRVHSKQPELGSCHLRNDPTPIITLRAAGPLYAEIEIRARYLHAGGKALPGSPQATYLFSYWAGSPLVHVTTDVRQEPAFSWDELHIGELFFKDDSFTQWASNDSGGLQPFQDEKQGHSGSDWGLLAEGKNLIGLLSPSLIYDGKNDYGRYLHGPWLPWTKPSLHFELCYWIGAAEDPVATIAQAAARDSFLAGTAYSPALWRVTQELAQRSRTQPALAWLLTLTQRSLALGEITLAQAEAAAQSLQKGMPPSGLFRLGDQILRIAASKRIGLALSPDLRSIVSLYDLQTRRELLAEPASWFRLSIKSNAGEMRTLEGGDFNIRELADGGSLRAWQQTASKARLQFIPRDPALAGLTVTLQPQLLADRLQFSLQIDNALAEWSLISVIAPLVSAAIPGNDPNAAHVLLPDGYGRAYPVANCPRYHARYPSGSACMQFMAVTDDSSGLYVAFHDPTASTKHLNCDPLSGLAGAGLSLSFDIPAPDATIPHNDFAVPGQFVLAAVDRGYFSACRLYQQWLEKNAPWWPAPGQYSRTDYPRWLTEIQTWVCWGAGYAEKTVEPTKQFAAAMGVPTALHWYNWHEIPFDDNYPHYFPTKPGFREGVRALQEAGIRVMPYINGRLWDTDTESFKAEAYKYATKQQDGRPYIEIYGSKQELAPMCVHTSFWQNKVQEIVLRLLGEEGVDAVYIDQVAAAASVLCYDKSHGHPLAGGHWWTDGYWKMLQGLREKMRAISSEKMLTTESNAEPFAKYFDAYLMCNSNSDYEVPLFPAVYGGKILMFGTYMKRSDWDDLTLMALRQGKLFAFGTQLWWSDPTIVSHDAATKWLRALAQLRRRVNEFFVHGRMAPPPVLREPIGMLATDWPSWGNRLIKIHTPDLWATAWQLEDKRLLFVFVNLPKQERVITLQFDPKIYGLPAQASFRLERLTQSGASETMTRRGAFVLPLRLGPAEATVLLLAPQR